MLYEPVCLAQRISSTPVEFKLDIIVFAWLESEPFNRLGYPLLEANRTVIEATPRETFAYGLTERHKVQLWYQPSYLRPISHRHCRLAGCLLLYIATYFHKASDPCLLLRWWIYPWCTDLAAFWSSS